MEEEEIVDATYGEKNKRPSSRSANDRNTVEGKKDYPASTPSKISNDKSRRSRKAKDKGAAAVGVNSDGGATYCIRYENNQSKRWDGKELLVDKDWVDELYPDGIYPGKQLELPWTGKKGKTVMWNAVVQCKKQHMEDQQDDQPKSPKVKQTKSKIPSKKEKGKVKGSIISVSSTQASTNDSLTARIVEQQASIIALLSDLINIHKHPHGNLNQQSSTSQQQILLQSQQNQQPLLHQSAIYQAQIPQQQPSIPKYQSMLQQQPVCSQQETLLSQQQLTPWQPSTPQQQALCPQQGLQSRPLAPLISQQQHEAQQHQLSIPQQQSSISRQQPSISRQQPSISRQQPSLPQQQSSISQQQSSTSQQQSSIPQQQSSISQQQLSIHHQQLSAPQQQTSKPQQQSPPHQQALIPQQELQSQLLVPLISQQKQQVQQQQALIPQQQTPIPQQQQQQEAPMLQQPLIPQQLAPMSQQPLTPQQRAPMSQQPLTPQQQAPMSQQPLTPQQQAPMSQHPLTSQQQAPMSQQPLAPQQQAPIQQQLLNPQQQLISQPIVSQIPLLQSTPQQQPLIPQLQSMTQQQSLFSQQQPASQQQQQQQQGLQLIQKNNILSYDDFWDTSTDDNTDLLDIWKVNPQSSTSNSTYHSSSDNDTILSTTPAVDSLQQSYSSDTSTASISNVSVQRPPFSTPPKLRPIEEVLEDHPGSSVASLRNLALSLAREAIFGKEQMIKCSLSGRKNTTSLDEKKLDYIKTVVRSRVPNMTQNEFDCIWGLCKSTISKSCQSLRNKTRRKLST